MPSIRLLRKGMFRLRTPHAAHLSPTRKCPKRISVAPPRPRRGEKAAAPAPGEKAALPWTNQRRTRLFSHRLSYRFRPSYRRSFSHRLSYRCRLPAAARSPTANPSVARLSSVRTAVIRTPLVLLPPLVLPLPPNQHYIHHAFLDRCSSTISGHNRRTTPIIFFISSQ